MLLGLCSELHESVSWKIYERNSEVLKHACRGIARGRMGEFLLEKFDGRRLKIGYFVSAFGRKRNLVLDC